MVYAPPEQFGGSPATPASDVYAATATFYECLTGRPPFTGDTAERLLYQHLSQAVPLEPVPEPLRPLVAAGLAKDPGDRPADGTALVAELRAVAGAAYGPDWEDRGRSGLAAAALLLAALWPSGGPAAAQGSTVHRISLRRHLRPRHISPVKGAIAVGVAVAVAVAVAVIVARPTGHTAPPPAPARVVASFSVNGSLRGVVATSATNAWAVGSTGSSLSPKPLIAHWNGTSWKQAPSSELPSGELRAVAATSADNAWAVGGTNSGQSLILHWNGTSWKQAPSAGAAGSLAGVSASSATNAWAVGSGSGSGKTLILHWNGTIWKQVPSPSPQGNLSLTSVAVTSGRNAWAVGDVFTSTSPAASLILHWNGTTWQKVPIPSPSDGKYGNALADVAATSATNAWAVGCTDGCPVGGTPLIERWNGTSWRQVAAPTTPYALYNLSAVAVSATSAWAVGGGGPITLEGTATTYWNGHSWTLSHGISGAGLAGVTATSATNAWAAGSTASGRTLILHWDGQMWSGTAGQLAPATRPASSPVSSSPSAVASPALQPRRQAAQALAGLLAQSGTDRVAVTQAFNAVADCSPGLSQDETTFSTAASSRQALLGKLAALADRSALPASMLQDLTTAWQASGEADQDLANWTQDEISHGCSTNYRSDASYKAATVPDDQATKDKKAFAALWTAIADEYGLPLYRYNQI